MKNVSIGTLARTGVLIFALINQGLAFGGFNPLPWTEDEVYTGLSLIITTAASIWSWWKNNSFTKSAIEADKYMKELKSKEI